MLHLKLSAISCQLNGRTFNYVWELSRPQKGISCLSIGGWVCPRVSLNREKFMTLTGIEPQPSSPKMISFSWLQTFWYPSGVPWRQGYCGCHQQHAWEDYCHPLARVISERVPIHGRSAHGNPVFYTWEWHIPIRLYCQQRRNSFLAFPWR